MAARPAPSPDSLELRRIFPVAPERVFHAWTDPGAMRRWFAPAGAAVVAAAADPRIGGRYHVHMRGDDGTAYRVSGTYREVDPPRRLAFTWRWETDPPDRESLVTIELTDRGGATEMVLTHARFATAQDRDGHGLGWETCLDKLAAELTG